MEMHQDDDDCVIKEIPVYLCKELADKLHLFQFPCKPADTNCSKNILSSRIKPESGIIELDNGLNTESEFYDPYVGEELAVTDSAKQTAKEKPKSSKLLDRITFQSQRSVLKKDITCYSIATIYDGKFCITPLHDAVSFLPTYEHVEKSKKSKTGSKSFIDDSSSSSEGEPDEGTSAVQVTVKFSQKREKTKISQEWSHQQHLSKVAEEPWCEAAYLNSTSSTAARLLEGLTNTVSRNRSAMLSLSQKQYLDVLVPPDTTDSIESTSTK
ncbi:DNA-directed RNA polymerase III subunit RPC5 isoform X2 [Planococcus citri]|uniref:DNA-directed RNA polymerase III subunit RPC5 isoform X2 n=1 Tax=Planococcus citri TaxID=170843 RepID=UPI0031F803FE